MSKPITHVLMVTDESGSMGHLADDVRGGFNQYVADLTDDTAAEYRLTVAMFNHDYRCMCVAANLADVPRLDGKNYRPGGNTALLDAIGRTVADFDQRVPELGEGERVLLVVQTDGHENSSREYNREAIKALITEREKGGRWSCVFLGAGIDAWAQAGGLGFLRGNTISVAATGQGTRSTYSGLSASTRSYSRGATAAEASGILADEAGTDGSNS